MPPLNEVAFPAYARLQDDMPALSASFLKAVRLIMLVTCPLYFGLAVVAQRRGDGGARRQVGGDGAAGLGARAGDAGDDAAHPVRARR